MSQKKTYFWDINKTETLKRVHFIAIGGAAMHNLAIALKNKGYEVSGSDDEIFEPSYSRLEKNGLLPEKFGWYPEKLTDKSLSVILGMHARPDNPELLKAKSLGIKIYSYPEFLYEQTKNKKRIVIAGSHGKTTITAMIIHVLRFSKFKFDFMVGSRIEGLENMVALSETTDIAVFEGDEYLSSPIDLRPKFIHYKPHIALISGIEWDHINVFPTSEKYTEQFKILSESIEQNGSLFYFNGDQKLSAICQQTRGDIHSRAYHEHAFVKDDSGWNLLTDSGVQIPIKLFGRHNLQNISGAKAICNALGISDDTFYKAMELFAGTQKRLQTLHQGDEYTCYLDFAHSPSKVKATVEAVKERHQKKKLTAIFELHTFSSLNSEFIPEYRGSMDQADEAIVYYDIEVLERKGIKDLKDSFLQAAFQKEGLKIISKKEDLLRILETREKQNNILLLMSSGNFSGLDLKGITS